MLTLNINSVAYTTIVAMPFIEIKTVHNIVLSYETASLLKRIWAYAIDLILAGIMGFIMIMTALLLGIPNKDAAGWCLGFAYSFYHLISENVLHGSSMGKSLVGIRIIKLTGRESGFSDFFIRWVFRLVDIGVSFGSVACILIGVSRKGQRLGDLVSNTVLVRTIHDKKIHLSHLTTYKTSDGYKPIYPMATLLHEEHALLIKNVLDRNEKYPNAASRSLAKDLYRKLLRELDIKNCQQQPLDFLKTLLKNYIVLTR